MPLIPKTQPMPQRPVVIVIYGLPGVGKTSLFNTAANPILIDCDRGADRSVNRQDTIVANNWNDILADKHLLDTYDTIGIDTAKAMLDDFLMDYVKSTDDMCRRNTQRAYGALGQEFKQFISELRGKQKDIVIIAHAKEDKDGDMTKFYPDVTGGSKDLLLRIADQVGFIYTVNNQRTVQFEPTDRTIGKNVAALPALVIPDQASVEFPTFMRTIIRATKERIQQRTAAQAEAIKAVEAIKAEIAAMQTAQDAKGVAAKLKGLEKMQRESVREAFDDKCAALNVVYNKETKNFELCTASA